MIDLVNKEWMMNEWIRKFSTQKIKQEYGDLNESNIINANWFELDLPTITFGRNLGAIFVHIAV